MKLLFVLFVTVCMVVLGCQSSTSETSGSSHGSSSTTMPRHHHKCFTILKQIRRKAVVSTTYTHWGRSECPQLPRTSTVYTGKAAGSRSSDRGGGANHLCMPLTVEYGPFENGTQFSSRSFLHGIEYETQDSPLFQVHNHDVPCAVCLVRNSPETLMIPGALNCPRGWRSEYSGYLVSSSQSSGNGNNTQEHYRTMFECLDRNPERFIGGVADGRREVGLFVLVEADCSTLPCPPYCAGAEVSCSVCSKSPSR